VLTSPIFAQRNLGGVHTNIYDLVASVKAAGIRRVTGRLLADATIFDSRRGVADSGYGTSPYIGPLSGLSFNMGFTTSLANRFSSSPEKLAALKLMKALESSGVEIAHGIAERPLPSRPPRARLGVLESPTLDSIVNTTNVYSVNFMAEMLMKGLGARFGGRGSTASGAVVVEAYARTLGSGLHAVDGSGLTRTNRASPAEVGRLLAGLRLRRGASSFVDSLPLAGSEGTLADRMEGSAAEGRCRAKTGTISGVSALSGYCFNRSGKTMVFSILMNGVWSTDRARLSQDRIAALIARY
jgi:D-alanyl-D-alanine carboxypeptidase/D-alanyl-D-alanine-endopeptidase (penicillin-binding protein 4)